MMGFADGLICGSYCELHNGLMGKSAILKLPSREVCLISSLHQQILAKCIWNSLEKLPK